MTIADHGEYCPTRWRVTPTARRESRRSRCVDHRLTSTERAMQIRAKASSRGITDFPLRGHDRARTGFEQRRGQAADAFATHELPGGCAARRQHDDVGIE
jgi:hypothetical protein